jgi:hypothetical protein
MADAVARPSHKIVHRGMFRDWVGKIVIRRELARG